GRPRKPAPCGRDQRQGRRPANRVRDHRNRYTAPAERSLLSPWPFSGLIPIARLLSPSEAIATVSWDAATVEPNTSRSPVFDALTYARWRHVAPVRANTYTAPAPSAESSRWSPSIPVAMLDSPRAPTTSRSPVSAT